VKHKDINHDRTRTNTQHLISRDSFTTSKKTWVDDYKEAQRQLRTYNAERYTVLYLSVRISICLYLSIYPKLFGFVQLKLKVYLDNFLLFKISVWISFNFSWNACMHVLEHYTYLLKGRQPLPGVSPSYTVCRFTNHCINLYGWFLLGLTNSQPDKHNHSENASGDSSPNVRYGIARKKHSRTVI